MEFFSLRNNDKKKTTNNKDLLNIKELISKLDILFEEQLSKTFKDILIIPRNNFLNIIISEVKNFLDEQYGEEIYKNEKFINFFSSSCNNLEDKYNTYMEELTSAWEDYESNRNLKNEKSYFFSNFRKHCIDTDNLAIHNCSEGNTGNFIQVLKKSKKGTINAKKRNVQSPQIQYLICNNCKTVYFSNKFMNYCKECNINYLSSILSYNEDPELLLATLERPHCDTLVNEKIKCMKCKDYCLYLNMKSNRLQCHNKSCTYNELPYNIEWICNICSKTFYSDVKIYNPVEIQQIKEIIKLTLLLKKKAHPSKVTCCKNINVQTQDFFHKKECNGLLYFGEYNSKTIIVCDKCKAINFLIKFIWTCPICGTRFKDKGNNSIHKEESKRIFLSPTHENRRNINNRKKPLYDNENNKENNNIDKNNNKINNSNEKKSNNNNSCRKKKETLSSLLKRKSLKNINDINNNKDDNNVENNPNLNNSISMGNYSKKEINIFDNTNMNQVKENIKNRKIMTRNVNSLEKSLTESKINKTFKKKNSILDKQIGRNIETISEETETKFNSPTNPKINSTEMVIDKNIIKESTITTNNRRIHRTRNSDKKYIKDNYLSPKINNNTIYNNYIKYVNINSNHKENVGSKIIISYSKRKADEGDNKNKIEIEKENNKNENYDDNRNIKRTFVGSYKHRTRRVIKEDKEGLLTNKKKDNNINNNRKEQEIVEEKNKNEEILNNNDNNKKYLSNYKTEEFSNNIKGSYIHMNSIKNNGNKDELAPISINASKYLFYKAKKGFHSQDNISENNSSREEDKHKYIYRAKHKEDNNNNNNCNNNNKNINRCETIKHENNNDALSIVIMNKRSLKYKEHINNKKDKEDNEKNENSSKIRYRSMYKNKTKDIKREKENSGLNELNKSDEENNSKILNKNNNNNNNENIQNSINQIRKRGLNKERIKYLKDNITQDENPKEKKTVRSRKETLKIREREKYLLQIEENQKEKEKEKELEIEKEKELTNLINKENNRYKPNILESRQESYKTKENTLSRYTKDSEISLDKNRHWGFRLSGDHYNIKRYKDKENNNDYNGNNNNKNEENNNNNNNFKTEFKRHFNTKKTRKEYINEKNNKNEENAIKENINKEVKTEKRKYKNSKTNIIISSYKGSLRRKRGNNDFEKNKNNYNNNSNNEEDIPIFDKELRKDKEKYEQLQRKLKQILYNSSLPKFNIDYYVIKNQVGIGSFGVIFQVYHIKTRCKYALKKIIAPDLPTLQQFEKEFELVHQNPHPNILDLLGICIQCVDLTNFVFYVLMDLAEEDWDTAINNRSKNKKYYSELELISILKQLTSALFFLQYEKKIAHRDIKPENILIFKNDIYKIGDFGEAKESKSLKQLSTLRGTELYMSPLLYNGLHDNKDDVRHNPFKSDVFSLGYCFIYAASLNLNIIYKIRDVNNIIMLKQILMKDFNGRYSEKFVDLILKMIAFDEDKRLDFIELEKILKEEF